MLAAADPELTLYHLFVSLDHNATGMMKTPMDWEHVVKEGEFTEDQVTFAFKESDVGTSVD